MTTELSTTQNQIQSKIYTIRGVQVMLDRDLAELYKVETSHLNRQVKRNADRFPPDFMFQLTQDEFEYLRCQNVTANWSKVRFLPYAFSEEGVATLASVLKNSFAADIHVSVMRAFVAMRRFIASNAGMFQRIESLEHHQIETDQKIDHVLDRLEEGTLREKAHIFSAGQIYDAKAFISELIGRANKMVVLIDGYVNATTINLLDARNEGVSATIYTNSVGKSLNSLQMEYIQQYPAKPLSIKKWKTEQHDRWLIIDDSLWHCGASLKDAGLKTFGIDPIGLAVDMILAQV